MNYLAKILGRDIKEEKDSHKNIVIHEGFLKKREISFEEFDRIFFFGDLDLRNFFCDSTIKQKVKYSHDEESPFSPFSFRSTSVYTFNGKLKQDEEISVDWAYVVWSYGDDNPIIGYALAFKGKNKKRLLPFLEKHKR